MQLLNILYRTLLFIFLCLSFTSCKKYLDKKSSNSYVTPQSLQDLQALLDDGDVTMNKLLTPSYGEASADDYFLLQSVYDPRTTTDKNIYAWVPTPYYWANDWSKAYIPVYNTNYCLERLADILETNDNQLEWNNVKGSALFYRAYNFLMLLWNYSKAYDETTSTDDLGIVLRLGSDFNVLSKRSNVADSYTQVIDDIKSAIPLLPNVSIHPYRPSKCAAYGLLARVYLSMRRYSEALENSELALAIKSDLLNFSTDISVSASQPFAPFNTETIFYTEMNAVNNQLIARGLIDTVLFQSYSVDDLRRTAFFTPNSGYYRFKGSYAGSSRFTGIATDELYLISAECYARAQNKDMALAKLNALLVKRWKTGTFMPFTTVNASEALKIILQERRKELISRGLRWIDVKRLNKEGANITLYRKINSQQLELPPSSNYYALPLPTDIINNSEIEQNPL